MADYIEKQKQELLKTFDDEPVVLVEIMSKMPEFDGKICAITKETAGFPSLDDLLKCGLAEDETFAFGVSYKCLDLMEKIEARFEKEAELQNKPRKKEKCSTVGIGKRCKNCKAVIDYDVTICPSCGKNPDVVYTYKPENKQEPVEIPAAQLWGIIGMVLFFIFLFVGCLIW